MRQFVQTMTKGLFQASLAGEGAPGWMSSYQDTQRDVLTDALTQHLTDHGALGIADRLVRQWHRNGLAEPAPEATPPAPSRPEPATER